MAATRHHVIVGAGTAGLAALEAIRRTRPDDPITMLSAEPDPPYSPTVLPHLLAGRIAESQVRLRTEAFFERARVRLLLGTEATGLDPDRRRLDCAGGAALDFDTLLLASGSEALVPALDNRQRVELHTFTRMADLRRLRTRLTTQSRVAILGAGLIGMELAEALVHVSRGIRVTVVEREHQVLPRGFDGRLAARIQTLFETRGVELRLGRRAVAVERAASALAVALSDGGVCPADLVVSCAGVRPRIGLARASGLASRLGIVVDSRMATSLPDVYAAGDVAEGPSASGETAPHPVLPTAASQGRVAGANMAGRSIEHEGWLPANVFSFFGRSAVSVGATDAGADRTRVERASVPGHGELVLDGERLVGASFLDVPVDPGALGWLIRERTPVAPHAELLVARPLEASRWLVARARRGAA